MTYIDRLSLCHWAVGESFWCVLRTYTGYAANPLWDLVPGPLTREQVLHASSRGWGWDERDRVALPRY